MLDFPIVDAHVHLIDRKRLRYSWMSGAPALNRDWTPADMSARTKPYDIGGYVFVEVDVDSPLHMEEANWVDQVAKTDPRLKGSVASLPLEQGPNSVEADLARLAALGTVRGVRRLIQDRPDPDFMIRPDFVANTIDLVRRCPDVSFILDHIAKPGIAAGLIDPWRAHMRDMAALPNVVCKVSGALTEADHAGWTREQLRPYIDHTIDCFGFKRLMFGGDWPVVELAGAYTQWLAVLEWAISGCSEAEKRQLFRETAIRAYRLEM
jgi:L-fuconolactonase